MNVIDRILSRPEFEESPPVVLDIGASGGLNPAWRRIRRYAECIAFDGDDSGIKSIPKAASDYKRLHLYNVLVTADTPGSAAFYLTKSPTCSSILPPNREQLSNWSFADRFEVRETRKVTTTNLSTILDELKLDRIDWFKTDSQGTDLRLFASLSDQILDRVLVAEFEPGIVDAYIGEDKLWQLMSFMEKRSFWMSDMRIKGSRWLRQDELSAFSSLEDHLAPLFLKRSPGWGELTYVNCFTNSDFTIREFLLGWVFAFLLKQYGFAMHIASTARKRFADPIFADLQKQSVSAIRLSYLKPKAYLDGAERLLGKLGRRG